MPCKQLDCIQCREIVAKRRAAKLYSRFGERGFSAFVFTFPRGWHDQIDADRVKELRTRVVRLLDEWAAAEHGVKRGWLVAFHPEGDERPGIWQPHFHVLSPLVGVPIDDPEALHELHKARADESFTGYIPEAELDSLKSGWYAVLTAIAVELGFDPLDVRSNLHYSFAAPGDEAKARHLLRYTARPFPAWSAKDSTLPKSRLLIGEFSLCSPRAKGGKLWRAFVRGLVRFGCDEPAYNAHELVTQGRVCPCCSGPLRAVVVVGVEDRRAPWVPAHDPDSGWWDGPPNKPNSASEAWMLTDDEIERYSIMFEPNTSANAAK